MLFGSPDLATLYGNVTNQCPPSPPASLQRLPITPHPTVVLGKQVLGYSVLNVIGDSPAMPLTLLNSLSLHMSSFVVEEVCLRLRGGGALSAGPSIVTEFPDIGAKLGCHSLIMLTIRLNHSGKSHKIPLSTLQWLFPIPSFSTWGGLEREENWFLCF